MRLIYMGSLTCALRLYSVPTSQGKLPSITVFSVWLLANATKKKMEIVMTHSVYYNSTGIQSAVIQVYRLEERLVRAGAVPPGKSRTDFFGVACADFAYTQTRW